MPLQRLWESMLIIVLLIVLGCGQDSQHDVMEDPVAVVPGDVMKQPELMGEVVVNDAGLPVSHWGRGRYVIEARGDKAPAIEDDTLAVTLSYSGGCEDHEFTLVASDAFAESYPVQLEVSLAHEANGDRCRAYLTETYGFDLTPIQTLYQEVYQAAAGTILLLLRDAPEDVPDLIYTFDSQG